MPEVEKIVLLDGLSDWICPPYNTRSEMFILPVADLSIIVRLKVPSSPSTGSFCMRLCQYPTEDTPPTGSQQTIITIPSIYAEGGAPYTAPGEWEYYCKPTTRFVRWRLMGGTEGINWGKVLFTMEYEVMSPAAYNQLMKGKNELDKKLETVARSITQFDEKSEEAGVKQAELVSANSLYENFLSDEIATYEILYPPTP